MNESRKRGRPPRPTPTLAAIGPVHTFGLRLRQKRRMSNLSRYRLAQLMGTPTSVLRNIEQCRHSPSLETLYRLRAAFGCEWTDLLGQ